MNLSITEAEMLAGKYRDINGDLVTDGAIVECYMHIRVAKGAADVEQLGTVRTYNPAGSEDVAVTEKAAVAPAIATAPPQFGG